MKKEPSKKTNDFLKTDGGKTQSNAIEVPSISLPKGGGALKGIDEKFSVNAVNGSGSFSIPLPFSPARGAAPEMTLSYNSGSGNGIFGLGWQHDLPSIKRKTEKELPQYFDAQDSDTFLFSGTEDLVPAFRKNPDGSLQTDLQGNYLLDEHDSSDGTFSIRRYLPRIEGAFSCIERWTVITTGEIRWRVITRENTTTLFGWTAQARISDPEHPEKVFQWLPEFVFDDKGNCAHYLFKREDAAGFDSFQLHNRNRMRNSTLTYTNLYPEKILYGNKTPYAGFGTAFPAATDYLFSTVFDYGEYATPPLTPQQDWSFRSDAFSEYKAGFEIRTTRLCKRILLFHHFTGQNEYNGLVKSLDFTYSTNGEEDFTFLSAVTAIGYLRKADGTYSHKALPPMEFSYQQHEWNSEVRTIAPDDCIHAPTGLSNGYQFVDLYNEGLSGMLTEQAGGWYYKRNLGDGAFSEAQLVSPKPSFSGLGSQLQLNDLDANGGKQLVSLGGDVEGYFELNDAEQWEPFRAFQSLPTIDFEDSNLRMLDLNGDGKPELLISEENAFTWYPSEGKKGYAAAIKTHKPFDEEAGPHILFSDQQQTIFLADMSGDGLTDIVRIRNGETCYWPNLGYGRFGAKIAFDHSPVFDHPDAFDPAFIRLADIDGSGTADIIYLGKNKFTCWKNRCGNRFGTTPFEITTFPEIHRQASITVTDLLGNGVACIVWSSSLSKDAHAPLRYIDLMNSKKPHLLVSWKNNLGKEVSLEYTPSTRFYLDDRNAGKPWVTKLHFPVHCISKTTVEDKISGHRYVSAYSYHHGYYDHPEAEFRGFGMVEQTDAETFEHWKKSGATNIVEADLHQEPVVSKNWYHTGAFIGKEHILDQFTEDYWYNERVRQGFPAVSHQEHPLTDAELTVAQGIDPAILETLSGQEWQEALRACKGMPLRAETFARDAAHYDNTAAAKEKEWLPFTVASKNCVIELIQPKGRNKHAVFVVKERESISYNYERTPGDPRISHNLNIRLDVYGNVLESASVVYPRRVPDGSLPAATRLEQDRRVITYVHNRFTDDALSEHSNRLRLPSEVSTYELKDVPKTDAYYSVADFEDILSNTHSKAVAYHETDLPPIPGKAQRRLIEHVRTLYYRNDLTAALPLHQLESLAISFENYQLAYTPAMLTDIFDTRVTDSLLVEGKFTHTEGDLNWWIRSGTTQLITGSETAATARSRFYAPVSYTDPYGSVTKVHYYGAYFLLIESTEDAFGNKNSVRQFNFRILKPQRIQDINGNLTEVLADELGLVKAVAVMGKNEADELTGLKEATDAAETAAVQQFFNSPDSTVLTARAKNLLQRATTRFVYDFEAYMLRQEPVVAATISREEHSHKNADSPVQISFEYSDGTGEVLLKKTQAEPGRAKQVVVGPGATISITETDTSLLVPQQLRWIGNGRTIKNNKGNPVKQYEPYFSVTHRFEDEEELVETGVTPVMHYDAPGRLIKTELPNGTFSKVVFDSWKQTIYDPNDTVLKSKWYLRRTDAARPDFITDLKEQQAAAKAAKHAETPTTLHFNTLGKPVLSIDHNKDAAGGDLYSKTLTKADPEGNLRSVTDDRGNTVMRYKYDMLGNPVYQHSMDAGQRWMLDNCIGNPLRNWDERGYEFQHFYDILHRPSHSKVIGGDDTLSHIFERTLYGENLLTAGRANEAALQARNCLGQVVQLYDTGGVVETPDYNFRGEPLATTRKLFSLYKEVPDWSVGNLGNNLEGAHTFKTETDALGRITKQEAPDGSIVTPAYNESGLLNGETVIHQGAGAAVPYILNIDYNEKGLREKITYGNQVSTRFHYDTETFRLIRLESQKQTGQHLQDYRYTYDPAGNITCIHDAAQPVQFFSNQQIVPENDYTYDALYRLIRATGKENDKALVFDKQDNWNDSAFLSELNPTDPLSVRNYVQTYAYDSVGNITEMDHQPNGAPNWKRSYTYALVNNRLLNTKVGSQTYTYHHHDKHGYMDELPHLEEMGWSFREEVVKTIRQRRTDGGTAETTWYQYDGKGQRIRKITENAAAPNATSTKKDERIYLSGYEIYKQHSGTHAGLERISLSLMDQEHRFVMIETRINGNDGSEQQLTRYQLHNHLGSAALELDDQARMISYEEYHPYGTTAYQARNKAIKAAAKRYRFTGMERDEETGLNYHSARYYLPWLGRWLSADPIGIGDGVNVYAYTRNNPMIARDPDGTQTQPQDFQAPATLPAGRDTVQQMLDRLDTFIDQDTASIASRQDRLTREEALVSGMRESATRTRYVNAIATLRQEIQGLQTRLNGLVAARTSIIADLTSWETHFRGGTNLSMTADVLTLAAVVQSEAANSNDAAKLAVAFGWLNRTGGETRAQRGEQLSNYEPLSRQWANVRDTSSARLFLTNFAASLHAANRRLTVANPSTVDPTGGATHWVSPGNLPAFNPRSRAHRSERYQRTVDTAADRAFPNWARAAGDPQIAVMQAAGRLGPNYAEVVIRGVPRTEFMFYRDVR